MSIYINRVSAEIVLPLRAAILRAGQPLERARFEGDAHKGNAHFAAYEDEALLGVGSILRAPPPQLADMGAWRVRGMAVTESARGRGVGRAILSAALRYAQAHKRLVWCYARVRAASLYERAGFKPIGEVFEFGENGPHLLMIRGPGPI